jgi:hypothetical protein
MSSSIPQQVFRNIAISLSLAVVALAITVQTAGAGEYSVYSCDAGSVAVPNASWVADPASDPLIAISSNCQPLSVVGIQNAGGSIPNNGFGALVFDAPQGTTIDAYRVAGQALVDDPGGEQYDVGLFATGGASQPIQGCLSTTDCDVELGNPFEYFSAPLGTDSLQLRVVCRSAGGCNVWNGSGGENAYLTASRAEVVLRDDEAPTVLASGTLAGGGTVGDILSADFDASDVGGGVASVALEIDGSVEDTQTPGGTCVEPYTEKQPCPPNFNGQFVVDTAGMAAGVHTWEIVATDASGNVGSSGVGAFYLSAPPAPPAPPLPPVDTPTNGSPAVSNPVVTFDKTLTKIKSGSTVVSGRILTQAGQPVVGATVTLQTLDVGVFDSEAKGAGTVVTDGEGRFSVKVRADGAKKVTAFFVPFAGAAPTAMFSTVVRQELSLSAKASRRVVKPLGSVSISGRLSGAGDAAADAPVEIQAVIRGKWRAIGSEEANSRGNYKWTYDFVNVRRSADFRFRAVVRRNAAWPWPSEFSEPVKVSVRP